MALTNLQREYLAYQAELDYLKQAQDFSSYPSRILAEEVDAAQAREKLLAVQATLAKPWDTYAGKGSRYRRDPEPQHPVAKECYRLNQRMNTSQEYADKLRDEYAGREVAIATAQWKQELVEIALATVAQQLESIPTTGNGGAWGARCLNELYGVKEAAGKLHNYWAMVAQEVQHGYVHN